MWEHLISGTFQPLAAVAGSNPAYCFLPVYQTGISGGHTAVEPFSSGNINTHYRRTFGVLGSGPGREPVWVLAECHTGAVSLFAQCVPE